ncbi:MAG: hypothetical protein PWP31_2033 [Clostridia bacterium]|nr:hypothetical protein [Clostridia bacterium]
MYFKKFISTLFILCSILFTCNSPVQASSLNTNVNIIIDNKPVNIPTGDQEAFISKGRTYIPLRVISENLGFSVHWKPETKRVIITSENNDYIIPKRSGNIEKVEIVINGAILTIPPDYGQAFIINGRTVLPFRAISEALGCKVSWEQSTRTVLISSNKIEPLIDPLFEELASYQTNLRLLDKRVINSAELLNMKRSDFSNEQIEQFETFLELLNNYEKEITLPDGTVVNTADIPIQGESIATADQLKAWVESKIPSLQQKYQEKFIPIPNLAETYIRIGAEYGIRGDLAFCQAAKETGYWQFTGIVKPFQNNYCGLGATGVPSTGNESYNGADPSLVDFEPGVHGAIFASPEIGVEAHIQHLYAYACKDPLPPGKVLYDPRFNLVERGCAPTWQELNGRWAVPGLTYGQSIIQDYWLKVLNTIYK